MSMLGWLVKRGAAALARALMADVFIGPRNRVSCLSDEPLICVANHTWCADVLITLLASGSLSRNYLVLGSQRVGRTLGPLKGLFGIVPLSASPISNIRTLNTVLSASRPKLAFWIFPQAIWIPHTWDTRGTIPGTSEKVIQMLNRKASILPVHIELVTVRQVRPAAVITFGDVIPKAAIDHRTVSDILADLRVEAMERMAGHCSEYYSLLHHDGLLFCGYPIRSRTIRQFTKRAIHAKHFQIVPTADGWHVITGFAAPMGEEAVRSALTANLPGVLASRFLRYTTIEVA